MCVCVCPSTSGKADRAMGNRELEREEDRLAETARPQNASSTRTRACEWSYKPEKRARAERMDGEPRGAPQKASVCLPTCVLVRGSRGKQAEGPVEPCDPRVILMPAWPLGGGGCERS